MGTCLGDDEGARGHHGRPEVAHRRPSAARTRLHLRRAVRRYTFKASTLFYAFLKGTQQLNLFVRHHQGHEVTLGPRVHLFEELGEEAALDGLQYVSGLDAKQFRDRSRVRLQCFLQRHLNKQALYVREIVSE